MEDFVLRSLNPDHAGEIKTVAKAMGKTLIDVLGEEKGQNYYSAEWLENRVREHIALGEQAQVLVVTANSEIVAHAIVRIEKQEWDDVALFSTLYVDSRYRKQGLGKSLVEKVLQWCLKKNISEVLYNTAIDNEPMQELLKKYGFRESLQTDEMIQFKKFF